jgi:hypothetical protein
MKPRHPNVEWIKKVLADIEQHRGDLRIAALMGDVTEGSLEQRRESCGHSRSLADLDAAAALIPEQDLAAMDLDAGSSLQPDPERSRT